MFFYPLFQAQDTFERLNLIVPGSLLCFKKDIGKLFGKELLFCAKKTRLEKIFRNKNNKPVFMNRNDLKKLVVKTKLR